jgi:hypothetical protein
MHHVADISTKEKERARDGGQLKPSTDISRCWVGRLDQLLAVP